MRVAPKTALGAEVEEEQVGGAVEDGWRYADFLATSEKSFLQSKRQASRDVQRAEILQRGTRRVQRHSRTMFQGERGQVLQRSLKEFLGRPENRPLVEKHQKREVKQAIALKQRVHELEFRQKLLSADSEAQQGVGPYLQNRVLRRIVMCLANDASGDFEKWAKNGRVLAMLKEAKALLDEGRLEEEEIEHIFLQQLKDPKNPNHEDFVEKTKQVVLQGTDLCRWTDGSAGVLGKV